MPYNVERLVHIVSNGDTAQVIQIQKEFEGTGKSQLPENVLKEVDLLNILLLDIIAVNEIYLYDLHCIW